MKNKKKIAKICSTCANCICIGEGDFICDVDEPILVMEDYIPTEDFCCCNECDWEEE